MKKLSRVLAALIIILTAACQKEDISASKPNLQNQVISDKSNAGNWDLTDTIP